MDGKKALMILAGAAMALALAGCAKEKEGMEGAKGKKKAIAYVTVPASDNWRWIGSDDPAGDKAVSGLDTRYVTHVNFAFGMIEALQTDAGGRPLHCAMDAPGGMAKINVVSKDAYLDGATGRHRYRATLRGWIEEMGARVDGSRYLRALVDLKRQAPGLKVLLSVGGWDSDGFCYMARTKEGRADFIASCAALVDEYGLDGIDIDWEYPTHPAWTEIAWCYNCEDDARALLREMRAAFDAKYGAGAKLVSAAVGGQPWIDAETLKSLDYVNAMCYDFNPAASGIESQAGLDQAGRIMRGHLAFAGGTSAARAKINLGVPFYNGGGPRLVPYRKGLPSPGYIVDAGPEITRAKMEWVRAEGFGGAFYWAYSMDVFEGDLGKAGGAGAAFAEGDAKILQRTVYEALNGS